MSENDKQVRRLITQEAADWFIANRAGLTAKEHYTFATWLQASPVHVEEYLALSVVARDLRQACNDPRHSLDGLLARAGLEEDAPAQPFWTRLVAGFGSGGPHRWQTVAVTTAALGALSLSLIGLWDFRPSVHGSTPGDSTSMHFETRHGEQQTRLLADNTVLHMNTDSAVTIRYDSKQRLVVLSSGEAEFEVSHENGRPFRVLAGSAEVVAIGTRFDVRLGQDATVVTVVEGRVAVGPSAMSTGGSANSNPAHPPPFVQLAADQQITVAKGVWPATAVAVDAQRTTAWLHRQIIFEHVPLERVASDFNRYARKPIEIITPALRNLEISGVFATDDTEAFIAFLRSLEGVRVEVTTTRIRVSQD